MKKRFVKEINKTILKSSKFNWHQIKLYSVFCIQNILYLLYNEYFCIHFTEIFCFCILYIIFRYKFIFCIFFPYIFMHNILFIKQNIILFTQNILYSLCLKFFISFNLFMINMKFLIFSHHT